MDRSHWLWVGLLMLVWWQAHPQTTVSPMASSERASPAIGQSDGGALAPGALGTRQSTPLRTAMPTGSGYAWLQLTVALVLVAVGLRYGLPRLLHWAGKTGIGSPLDGQIRLLENRAVPGGSLCLVKARDRLLLIGITPQSIQLLADLTPTHSASSPASLPSDEFSAILQRAATAEAKQGDPYLRGTVADLQQETANELQAHLSSVRARLARLSTGHATPNESRQAEV